MDTWFRSVHRATAALVEACGFSLATPRVSGCCGALHAHAGVDGIAREMALKTMDSMPGDEPIVVNSAGCGAMLREYGELLGTESAHAFSARVMDIHEWIEEHQQRLVSLDRRRRLRSSTQSPFVVQEPCHLKHVQRISLSDVLAKFVPVIRLDDDGLCCGAGGAYSLMQSDMSKEIRSRKSEAIRRASGRTTPYVVTANPGCHLHLAGDGHTMISSVEVIAGSLGLVDLDPFEREDRTSHDF